MFKDLTRWNFDLCPPVKDDVRIFCFTRSRSPVRSFHGDCKRHDIKPIIDYTHYDLLHICVIFIRTQSSYNTNIMLLGNFSTGFYAYLGKIGYSQSQDGTMVKELWANTVNSCLSLSNLHNLLQFRHFISTTCHSMRHTIMESKRKPNGHEVESLLLAE